MDKKRGVLMHKVSIIVGLMEGQIYVALPLHAE